MILVTGGAGFIGSNLVYRLNKMGVDDIIIVDNLSNSEKHLNLNKLKFADYVDKNIFIQEQQKYKNVETVFHQGACTDTTETDGRYMMANNYEYSKLLLDFSIENNIDFIYASSAAVYGNGDKGFLEEPECEYPLNIYGFSKLAFDNYVRDKLRKEQPDIQILGLRYFNVYGYQENHKGDMTSVAYKFFKQIQNGGNMELFEGSENFIRDFIFIEDVIDTVLWFYKNKKSGIFNCGTGNPDSFLNIAKLLKENQKQADYVFKPFPDHLRGKYQTYTCADLNKLRKTGYTKEFLNLKTGIDKYYQKLMETEGFFK